MNIPDLPLVTIITVCKNEAKHIEKTIQSVIYQTYENIEYIVVDGSSEDGTLDIINNYKENIKLILNNDTGIYEAMNDGIEAANGDFILLLNGGDWYEIDTVESLLSCYYATNNEIISACANKVDIDGNVISMIGKMPYDLSIYLGMPIRHEAMLVPSFIYKTIKYNPYYRIISDHDFAIKLYKSGYKHYEIPKCLLNFRDNGISNDDFAKITQEREYLLREHVKHLSNKDIKVLANEQLLDKENLSEICVNNNEEVNDILISYAARRHIMDKETQQLLNKKREPIKLSIIIPVLNGQDTIEVTLKSILEQANKHIEIICVNDCSTDKTREVIDTTIKACRLKMLLNDQWDDITDNIIVLHNQKQKGVSFSRNLATNCAKGDYIFYIDADDKILPGAINKLIEEMDNDSDIIMGNIKLINSDNYKGIINSETKKGDVYELQELVNSTENFLGSIYKKDLAKNILFCNYKMGEDSLFWIQAVLMARQIKLINYDIYEYNNMNANSAQHNYTLEKYINELQWREKASTLLKYAGLKEARDNLINNYWNRKAFNILKNVLNNQEYQKFIERLDIFINNMQLDEDSAEELKELLGITCYI